MVLRQADVVEAALVLLDAEGLEGLTMRKLSASLNVQGGALYRHFQSKEALLDAMAERLMAGVAQAPPEASELPWPDQLREMAERLRAVLLAQRDGARVVAGTYVPGPNTMTATGEAVGRLCAAGFSPEKAGWITYALFYYVLGHTIEEQAQSRIGADEWLARIASAETRAVEPLTTALRSVVTADPGERFGFGLTVFISGLMMNLAEGGSAA